MNHFTRSRRRVARDVARAATALSAAMLMFGLAVGHVDHVNAAGTDLGTVQIKTPVGDPLTSGGSGTEFSMVPPAGAACPGSGSGTPPYRWQTFMVADSVDVSNLTYSTGPNAVGTAFVQPMYDHAGGTPVVNQNPSASPLGLISGIPTVSFAAFTPGFVPPGDYKIGFACTLAGATVSFWTARISVTTDVSDSPAQFTWNVLPPPAPPITNLAAAQIAGPGVRLSWTAPAGTSPTSYTIGVTPAVTGAPFTALGSATTFDVTGLVAGTAYSLTVTANYATPRLTGPVATVQFTFVAPTTVAATTTTSTTAAATTTTVAGTTTTTAGVTTTTVRSAAAPVVATSTIAPFVTTLATTGSSSVPLFFWAILLVVFGRLAVLLARPVRTRPPESR